MWEARAAGRLQLGMEAVDKLCPAQLRFQTAGMVEEEAVLCCVVCGVVRSMRQMELPNPDQREQFYKLTLMHLEQCKLRLSGPGLLARTEIGAAR